MCAEPCSNYSLAQTSSLLWRRAQSLSSRFPPGIALHGDEWELILGIKMLFPWGCGGGGNAVSCCLKCTLLARRPAAASENTPPAQPEDSLRTPKLFDGRSFRSTGTAPGSHAKLPLPLQLFQAQLLFLGQSTMASRKPHKQRMLLLSPLVAHAFLGLGLWLSECDYIPWRL